MEYKIVTFLFLFLFLMLSFLYREGLFHDAIAIFDSFASRKIQPEVISRKRGKKEKKMKRGQGKEGKEEDISLIKYLHNI